MKKIIFILLVSFIFLNFTEEKTTPEKPKLIIGIVEVVKEHYPDPTDKTGFTIFKILGSAQTVILTLFCQAIDPMNIKKNRLAIIFFIVHLSFIF